MDGSNIKPLICVLCGTPWDNEIANRCKNSNCDGFCSWGYELNKPLSFTVAGDGNWIPNIPKKEGILGELEDKFNAPNLKNIKQQIRDGSYKIAKDNFEFEKIFNFCQTHRVEILMQEDTLFHCFIDYTPGSEDGSWAAEFDGFTSMIKGITQFLEIKEKPTNA
jgi:hypothetical protein